MPRSSSVPSTRWFFQPSVWAACGGAMFNSVMTEILLWTSCKFISSTFLIVVIGKKDLYSSMTLRAQSTPNPEKTKDESTGKGGKMVPWQSHRAQKRGEVDSRMRQEKDLWLTAGLTKLLQELNCSRRFSLSPTWNLTFCQQLESR